MPPRRPAFDTYSPGRRDKRIGEARAFLQGARHLRNMTARSVEVQFNLLPATAADLLKYETARREMGE